MYAVKGLGACILDAELHSPKRKVSTHVSPTIAWKEDTEENRKNEKLGWMDFMGDKWRFAALSEEQKEQIAIHEKEKLKFMFNYILRQYGWKYAEDFYFNTSWAEKFKKAGIKIEIDYPHCKYTKDKQCDLFCPHFRGKCDYKEV